MKKLRVPLDIGVLAGTFAVLTINQAAWPYWAAFACVVAWRGWLHRPSRHA